MVNKQKVSIFWFRKDLRLTDNPGLHEAVQQGSVLPIFIVDQDVLAREGQASRWWLYHALSDLDASLDHRLQVYQGNTEAVLLALGKKYAIEKIYWNKIYEPSFLHADQHLQKKLDAHGIQGIIGRGNLLWEPSQVLKADGTPYRVYTPFFYNGCLQATPPAHPLPAPSHASWFVDADNHVTLDHAFSHLFGKDWPKERVADWQISEKAALKAVHQFVSKQLIGYKVNRDFPSKSSTSRLSPYLHFGQISPQYIWHAVLEAEKKHHIPHADVDSFLREVGWREFSYNLLYHFPTLPDKNFQPKFDAFPWKANAKYLHAWQQGQTGYPLVDAGMRELLQTGYMHNRVRMVVGSFLIKNLLLDWRYGRDWFWEHLVDADLANNSASWQWVAGSGADAAPYFRIFNPTTQGEKFDELGRYTRKFVPELKNVSDQYLFEPWKAPALLLLQAGVVLGKEYPLPIVSIEDSRKIALEAYHTL